MKVYAVNQDLNLVVFPSIKAFEAEHNWLSTEFLSIRTAVQLKVYKDPSGLSDDCPIKSKQKNYRIAQAILFGVGCALRDK